MSLSIESLVRPFQTVDVFAGAPRRGPVDPAPSAVVLEIGKDGTPKTFTGSFSFSTSGFMSTQHRETRRKVQPVDVKNPDDPEQKVRLNATQQLDSNVNRGRNYQRIKRTFNKDGDLKDLTNVEKIGGTKEVKTPVG